MTINENSIIKFCLLTTLKISMKKNAAIGIDKLSEPLILIASEIVIAKLHSIIAKKEPRLSNC